MLTAILVFLVVAVTAATAIGFSLTLFGYPFAGRDVVELAQHIFLMSLAVAVIVVLILKAVEP